MIYNKQFLKYDFFQEDIKNLYQDIFLEYESGEVGYYDLPKGKIVKEIKKFCLDYDLSEIKNIAILGIGGSSLGTKAIDYLLKNSKNRNDKRVVYFENVDPNDAKDNLKDLEFSQTLFLVISKSGGTIETTSYLKFLLHTFDVSLQSEEFKRHFVFITDEKSPLDTLGEELNVKRFYIPKNVGGRFSVLSYVGLLPLALVGYDIENLLDGALSLRQSFFDQNEDDLCKKAIFYAKNSEVMPINVLFCYSSSFKYFNDWYVQLWAESLGKIDIDGNRVGLTPVGLIGSIDQHSFLQLIIDGVRDKTVTMIKVKEFANDFNIPDIKLNYLEKTNFINNHTFSQLINAQCDATLQSIVEQNVPVDLIEMTQLDEKSVGYIIYYFELLTSLVGKLLNINTYNQPGVELGKVILKNRFEQN